VVVSEQYALHIGVCFNDEALSHCLGLFCVTCLLLVQHFIRLSDMNVIVVINISNNNSNNIIFFFVVCSLSDKQLLCSYFLSVRFDQNS